MDGFDTERLLPTERQYGRLGRHKAERIAELINSAVRDTCGR